MLECLRFALDLPPKGKQAQKVHQEIIKENLGRSAGRVELTVVSSAQNGKQYTISRRHGVQFLFATHNANIPVFGDAEWIGVFTAAENQGRLGLEAQGSIDVPVIRDQVASILEGGRDAFIQRKEKYEF